ncbi:MAG: hypothetical protein FJ267_15015, partial [Planctomycetes bacterium]|nr:hypothetical protein [Planctomycetota bacterium]
MRIPHFLALSSIVVVVTLAISCQTAGAIENQKGKTYKLSEKHGPWMIMVSNFRDVREEDRKTEGMTADEAVSELIYELREKGIPAYTYSLNGKVETIETRDRLGRDDTRIYAAQRDMICVVAGNYPSIEDPVGQKTLNYIKKFQPKFMKTGKSGAVVRLTSAQKGPFSQAFMTINPLINPADVARQHVDKETKYLNSGVDNSLLDLKKKYSLKVATFTGKSTTPIGSSSYAGREDQFDRELQKTNDNNIVRAGEDAAQLARALRQQRIEAYVYHDKVQSIVTVGGFDSKTDSRIPQL